MSENNLDRAAEVEAILTEDAIAHQKHRANKEAQKLVATGRCLFCSEAVSSGLRFCAIDCRDDYEHEQQAKVRAGRA